MANIPLSVDMTEIDRKLDVFEEVIQRQSADITALRARIAILEAPPAPVPVPDPIPVPDLTPTTFPILCADPARAYAWWPEGENRDQAMAFMQQRIRLTEAHAAQYMPGYTGLVWIYTLDLSVMLNDDADFHDADACPNEWFILNPSGSRYSQYIWNTARWFWDFSNADARAHVIERLKAKCASYPVLFLDEHAQIIGQPTTVVVQFLHELRAALPDKHIIPNTSQSSLNAGYIEQVRACGSVDFEIAFSSDGMRGWDFRWFDALAEEISGRGGIVLLTGSIGWAGPHGDAQREQMWRLAGYWLMKRPGVYLDLMSSPTDTNDLSFREWCKAMEFDLGQPLGPMIGEDMGGGAIVFRREYEKAWVYLRGRDSYLTTDYGVNSAVIIPIDASLKELLPSGEYLQFVAPAGLELRTADSAILLKP